MTGIFILKKGYVLSSLMVPLIGGTFFWSLYTAKSFEPLSGFVNLSSVFEVQRGEDTEDVIRMRAGHPVTWSQRFVTLEFAIRYIPLTSFSNLSRRRYAQNDETLYVAPEDERTDYVCINDLIIVKFLILYLVSTSYGELVQWSSEVSICSYGTESYSHFGAQYRKTAVCTSGIERCFTTTVATFEKGPNTGEQRIRNAKQQEERGCRSYPAQAL